MQIVKLWRLLSSLATCTLQSGVNMLTFFFSPVGRIGRLQWWMGHIAVLALTAAFAVWLADTCGITDEASAESLPPIIDIMSFVLFFSTLWINCCLTIKRYHDLDRSGWWLIIMFIPVIQFWAILECGFFSGSDGPNDYGERFSMFGRQGLSEELEAMRRRNRQAMATAPSSFSISPREDSRPEPGETSGQTRFGRLGT